MHFSGGGGASVHRQAVKMTVEGAVPGVADASENASATAAITGGNSGVPGAATRLFDVGADESDVDMAEDDDDDDADMEDVQEHR